MTTPAERDAIRAEAFREAAEIARELGEAFDDMSGRSLAIACFEVVKAIEARAKEKQP
jgi:hypothetical protein